MRGCRWDLVLIVHAPTANINYDSKDNFYEELEQVFYHFPTCHMQIFFWCRKAKYGTEDRFKPTAGKYDTAWTLQKMWEYKGTIHHLFMDFKKIYDLFRRKVLNKIRIEFGINMKLLSWKKMCLNESYMNVRVGKSILIQFLLRMVRKKKIVYHQRFYTLL
jgi:hypothetical protein